MSALIEIKGLSSKTGDGRILFDNACLELKEGERVLLTAPVASGKGVLVTYLSGLARPDSGEIYVFGTDITRLKVDELNLVRKRMGFIFQENILISNLKVLENVALPLLYHTELHYDESMERALSLLEASGFRGDPWGLPGGLAVYEKKEVAVARAISIEPDIIICENLSDGLTESERAHLSGLLLKYQEESPGRLLFFTANNDADAGLVKPGRILRIEDNRFTE